MTRIYYSERRRDSTGEWLEVWHCPTPPSGLVYAVISQEWSDDLSVRHIHEVAVKENA